MRDEYKISKVDKRDSRLTVCRLLLDGGQYKIPLRPGCGAKTETAHGWYTKDCDLEYAKQVTSDIRWQNEKNGKRGTMVWKQKHSHGDNHYLDCEVYAFAAAEIMGVRTLHTQTESAEKQQKKQKKLHSEESWIETNEDWMKGG